MEKKSSLIQGEKTAIKGLIIIVILILLKIVAATLTGMVVLFADALTSGTDLITLFASYIGLKLSRKAANRKFEYGYYKVETLGALLASLFIIYFGYEIFKKAIESFSSPEVVKYAYIGVFSTVISITISVILAIKLTKAAKEINSISLMDNALEKKMDVIAGVAVLVSIFSKIYGINYVEGIVSILLSLMIFRVGIKSTKETLFFMLDYWDDPKLLKKIKNIILKKTDIILSIKKIRMRRAGTFIFGEAFVEVNPFADIVELREELDIMSKKIKETNPFIKDFAILTYIPKLKKIRIGVPITSGTNLSAKVAKNLRSTKAYEFVDIKEGKIIKKYRRSIKTGTKSIDKLIEFLKKEKVNIIIDNGLNSLVYYDLRQYNHVQIYPNFSNIKDVNEAVKLLMIDI
jgi:cation diffusion facilitator family transporter